LSSPSFSFFDFLKQKNIDYTTQTHNNLTIYIFDHIIPHGKYGGTSVTIGLPIPSDFDTNPPYGMHIKKNHGIDGNIKAPTASVLGTEWEFWSRQVNNWASATNKPQYYLDHVNRWLER